MTLTEFLLARIAEDEAAARRAPSDSGWYVDAEEVWVLHDDEGESASGLTGPLPIWADGAGEHIARWDPARVLAECEAKRLVIHHTQPTFFPLHPANHGCGKCNALRAMALPYTDHPDFIPDWHL